MARRRTHALAAVGPGDALAEPHRRSWHVDAATQAQAVTTRVGAKTAFLPMLAVFCW